MAAMLTSPATACVYRGTLVHSVAIGKVKVSSTSKQLPNTVLSRGGAAYETKSPGEERASIVCILHHVKPIGIVALICDANLKLPPLLQSLNAGMLVSRLPA